MKTTSGAFEQVAGVCAILAGVIGFLYSLSFVLIRNDTLTALCLMAGGLLTMVVMVALYERLRATDPAVALLALVFGVIGALGAAAHGGYDLANAINPPAANPVSDANLPFALDPRGLLTFGLAGLALGLVAWLMGRSRAFPMPLVYLGYALAALLVITYLGRLIILDPTNPLIVAVVLPTGFLINPAWYIWLGLTLRGQRQAEASPMAARS
jgi:hypothetical protein